MLAQVAQDHIRTEQRSLSKRFRWLVLGMTAAFLLAINISILVLLRVATIILRPVDELVEATGQLAKERFDHRVQLDQQDEFGQLARAYNRMAEQLQSSEQRKIEILGQVAVTLNHELNNATGIIESQLALLARKAGAGGALELQLRQIHESLVRMTETVEALKHVRRIVLKDYVSGVKMLDLQRSTQAEEAAQEMQPTALQKGKIGDGSN